MINNFSKQTSEDWTIVGHRPNYYPGNHPLTPRAVYSFKPRIRHQDYSKGRKVKNHNFDSSFPLNATVNQIEYYQKFPKRKGPVSVKARRVRQDFADFLGTQLLFVSSKKSNRFPLQ